MGDEAALRIAVRQVAWRDLVAVRSAAGLVECLHPLPWLACSWIFAHFALWPFALFCSFMFFLTALRLNHEAIQHNLGFGPLGHRLVLHGLSAAMLGSNHSVAFNHLRHHSHINSARDVEGKCGRMSLAQVIAYGPGFPIECHIQALRHGGPQWRRNILTDLLLNMLLPAVALLAGSHAIAYHLAAMLVAQCFTAMFAVWITHHGCDDHILVARTQRNRLLNLVSYNKFFSTSSTTCFQRYQSSNCRN